MKNSQNYLPDPGQATLGNYKVCMLCDDPDNGYIWSHLLRKDGLDIELTDSPALAERLGKEDPVDLIIIDESTTKLDGIKAIQCLREKFSSPILYITPTCNESHIVKAYELGVDECVVKPVSPALFSAKVRAILRRSRNVPAELSNKLCAGDLTLTRNHRFVINGENKPVKLSNLEYRLLFLLMKHPNWVFNSEDIINQVWGYSGQGSKQLLKHLIFRLRKKIEPDPHEPTYIKAENGGYVFKPDQKSV